MSRTKDELRNEVVELFESLVVGPTGGHDEFVEGKRGLTLRYLTGILFPLGQNRSDLSSENEHFDVDERSSEIETRDQFSGDHENPLSMANEELPSSVGISFVVKDGQNFAVKIAAAKYMFESDKALEGYRRFPMKAETYDSKNLLESSERKVFDGAAVLHVLARQSSFNKNQKVVTISLVNSQKSEEKGKNARKNVEKRLYQVELQVTTSEKGFEPYDSFNSESSDLEENILELQHSETPVYAVGHGCSVDWDLGSTNRVQSIGVAYVPKQTVHRPLFDSLSIDTDTYFQNEDVFSIYSLAKGIDSREAITLKLKSLVEFYAKWIESQEKKCDGRLEAAEQHLLSKMQECCDRMMGGLELLSRDHDCWQAFVMSNQAMLYQIEQTQRISSLRSEREKIGQPWPILPSEKIQTSSIDPDDVYTDLDSPKWRPFQLAFFLLSFSGLEGNKAENRIVDLIWFSTGGGKTEAYLLLASYELIRRRLRYRENALGFGTGVITRYTLRFLTADQFNRTASLGCALEKLRHNNLKILGNEKFTVGLYVGNESSSYRYVSDAELDINKLQISSDVNHKFHILECPNCGTSLFPSKQGAGESRENARLGVSIVGSRVQYHCTNSKCLFFSTLQIPVVVSDEEIYDSPPSFLLGTLDKFAMVPWKEESARIFGARSRHKHVVPPSLIIQDELHLISGPLGTISAIYEAAFDELIKEGQKKVGLEKTGPKYIASSATVRDSSKQIERLMGRESSIFPPRGVRHNDSFFSKLDDDPTVGRLYIGLMAQGLRSTSAMHWVSGAFLQSVRHVSNLQEKRSELDFLWTTLCYCNSKRELGLIVAAVNQEILDRMKVCADALNIDTDDIPYLKKEEVSSDGVVSISETRSELLIPVSDSGQNYAKDFVPCTNMISVGIDIDRLGSMIVNGQPKSTSEYIQATSRVGRSPINKGPGLVLTLYSPAKPRDRSHYEHFKSYHESLYRLVEPTSITPGSEPALKRAMHAAIVALVRHGVPNMSGNQDAANINSKSIEIQEIVNKLEKRLLDAYPDDSEYAYEHMQIKNYISETLQKWQNWGESSLLSYLSSDRSRDSLLVRYNYRKNASGVGFKTMQSMRGVDAEVDVQV